ncbi:hypothetical protein HN385_02730 [archaeon]|jgi:large subunit ribosomal protein L1|nr:hypothetical protein [archaeon]MBT3450666.1 hypothetical protein [archaeon]MBT6868754.1 hypothetical protein [archaeon]MBT7193025.1 hypothetical protein [archaeon]MBT7380991.1 hypothetical protein [archaeon]
MDKKRVFEVLKELKEKTKKRNFVQSYDLIINLKNINIKQNSVNHSVIMPFPKGKKIKVAAFVGPELDEQANKFCDLVIKEAQFKDFDAKKIKKVAQEYDYFIAQASLMPKVAAAFGKILGTKGKMPNPKLGCVIPPNASLDVLITKLSKTIQMVARKATNLQCIVGKENMSDEEIAENIISVYHSTVKQLPNELQNVKNVKIKLTMSKAVTV